MLLLELEVCQKRRNELMVPGLVMVASFHPVELWQDICLHRAEEPRACPPLPRSQMKKLGQSTDDLPVVTELP